MWYTTIVARPVIGNNGSGISEPIIKVPSGEDIIIRSSTWDFVVNDNCVKIINKKTSKIVFSIDSSEIIIGDRSGEHIRLKQ